MNDFHKFNKICIEYQLRQMHLIQMHEARELSEKVDENIKKYKSEIEEGKNNA